MSADWDASVDKEPARLSIRLIVANQRLKPNYIKQDYYHSIGQGKRLVRREEGMERGGKGDRINEAEE